MGKGEGYCWQHERRQVEDSAFWLLQGKQEERNCCLPFHFCWWGSWAKGEGENVPSLGMTIHRLPIQIIIKSQRSFGDFPDVIRVVVLIFLPSWWHLEISRWNLEFSKKIFFFKLMFLFYLGLPNISGHALLWGSETHRNTVPAPLTAYYSVLLSISESIPEPFKK